MATIKPVFTELDTHTTKIFWETITRSDTAEAVAVDSHKAMRTLAGSFQISGTFDTTTVTLEVSNDGSAYHTLEDRAGNAISMTAAGMEEFSTAALFIKPGISGGGTDDIDVTMTLRGNLLFK